MARQKRVDVVAARRTFSAGRNRVIRKGETFRLGHPLVEQFPREFTDWQVDNEFEQATAAPGERRGDRT